MCFKLCCFGFMLFVVIDGDNNVCIVFIVFLNVVVCNGWNVNASIGVSGEYFISIVDVISFGFLFFIIVVMMLFILILMIVNGWMYKLSLMMKDSMSSVKSFGEYRFSRDYVVSSCLCKLIVYVWYLCLFKDFVIL